MNSLKWIAVFLILAISGYGLKAGADARQIAERERLADEGGKLLRASYSPLHFKPAIDTATDAQCLACHKEVLEDKPRVASPAGVRAADSIAWYQRTSTYSGEQDSFPSPAPGDADGAGLDEPALHHLPSGPGPARGSAGLLGDGDAPDRSPASPCASRSIRKPPASSATASFRPRRSWACPARGPRSRTCSRTTAWRCHAAIRTNRHQVSYLNADAIEAAAREGTANKPAATSATAATVAAPGTASPTPMRATPGPACPKRRRSGRACGRAIPNALPDTSSAAPAGAH
jgi:hypothetical protein